MVRATGIFGVSSAVVVTQGFHMSRALFLAEEAGIDATGLVSDLHPLWLPGQEERCPRGPLTGQGDRRRHPRHPGDGRPDDPDRDHRRPRKLGPGAATRHAAGRFARPLAAARQRVGLAAAQANVDPMSGDWINVADVERAAGERLEPGPLGYFAGGAGDEVTLRDNVERLAALAAAAAGADRDVERGLDRGRAARGAGSRCRCWSPRSPTSGWSTRRARWRWPAPPPRPAP